MGEVEDVMASRDILMLPLCGGTWYSNWLGRRSLVTPGRSVTLPSTLPVPAADSVSTGASKASGVSGLESSGLLSPSPQRRGGVCVDVSSPSGCGGNDV
jgi:hypothetical protein